MYKEKCKWCETDRTDGIQAREGDAHSARTAFGYQSNIVKFKEGNINEDFYGQPGNDREKVVCS